MIVKDGECSGTRLPTTRYDDDDDDDDILVAHFICNLERNKRQ